jgi:hypothetical protein
MMTQTLTGIPPRVRVSGGWCTHSNKAGQCGTDDGTGRLAPSPGIDVPTFCGGDDCMKCDAHERFLCGMLDAARVEVMRARGESPGPNAARSDAADVARDLQRTSP